jgi:hypothetical protein
LLSTTQDGLVSQLFICLSLSLAKHWTTALRQQASHSLGSMGSSTCSRNFYRSLGTTLDVCSAAAQPDISLATWVPLPAAEASIALSWPNIDWQQKQQSLSLGQTLDVRSAASLGGIARRQHNQTFAWQHEYLDRQQKHLSLSLGQTLDVRSAAAQPMIRLAVAWQLGFLDRQQKHWLRSLNTRKYGHSLGNTISWSPATSIGSLGGNTNSYTRKDRSAIL